MSIFFPIAVFALALAMLAAHTRSWHRSQASPLPAAEMAFRRSRYGRRMQTSFLLALVGCAMLAGYDVLAEQHPWVFVGLWGTVAVATCWIVGLAIVDAVASGRHYHRIISERSTVHAELKAEMERIIAEAREGNSASPPVDSH